MKEFLHPSASSVPLVVFFVQQHELLLMLATIAQGHGEDKTMKIPFVMSPFGRIWAAGKMRHTCFD